MQFAKWVHVKIQGWMGLATVLIPGQATAEDLKAMLGIEHYGGVTIRASFLPLPADTRIAEYVNEFDTVWIEP